MMRRKKKQQQQQQHESFDELRNFILKILSFVLFYYYIVMHCA
jgi:hypothetical protein